VQVVNLTGMIAAHAGNVLVKPLIAAAGTDISHWFDAHTRDVRLQIDPLTGLEVPFTPGGRLLHCPPSAPRADYRTDFGVPWWKVRAHTQPPISTSEGEGGMGEREIRMLILIAADADIVH